MLVSGERLTCGRPARSTHMLEVEFDDAADPSRIAFTCLPDWRQPLGSADMMLAMTPKLRRTCIPNERTCKEYA